MINDKVLFWVLVGAGITFGVVGFTVMFGNLIGDI